MKNKIVNFGIVAVLFLTVVATVKAVSYTTLSSVNLINSLVDNTPIGSVTPSTGAFSSLKDTGVVSSFLETDSGGTVQAAPNTGGGTFLLAVPSATFQVQGIRITSGICTAAAAEQICGPITGTWGHAFPDSNYALSCNYFQPTGSGSSPGAYGPYLVTKGSTGFTLSLQGGSAAAAGNVTSAEIDCTGVHP